MKKNFYLQMVIVILCLIILIPVSFCNAENNSDKTQKIPDLTKYKDTYDHEKVLDIPVVNAHVRQLLGNQQYKHLKTNLATIFPIEIKDGYVILQGIAAHRGGEEEAIVLINPETKDFKVGLFSNKKILIFSETTDFNALPKILREWIAEENNTNLFLKEKFTADVAPNNLIWNKKEPNKTKK